MVQFSSLDEVYGKDFTRKYEEKLVSQQDLTRVHFDKDPLPLFLKEKGYNQSQCFEVKAPQSVSPPQSLQPPSQRYQEMVRKSETDRIQQTTNMNQIERPSSNEKFDQMHKGQSPLALGAYGSMKNEGCSYYNAEEKLKKQMLMERIHFVENQLKQYKEKNRFQSPSQPIQQEQPKPSQKQQTQEHFQSQYAPVSPSTTTNQELFQLMLMTAMGLLFIYIMDSIFEMGKKIGAKHK
jgi:alpha-galactosidase/6-phospho-beta-glucosidase family protein